MAYGFRTINANKPRAANYRSTAHGSGALRRTPPMERNSRTLDSKTARGKKRAVAETPSPGYSPDSDNSEDNRMSKRRKTKTSSASERVLPSIESEATLDSAPHDYIDLSDVKHEQDGSDTNVTVKLENDNEDHSNNHFFVSSPASQSIAAERSSAQPRNIKHEQLEADRPLVVDSPPLQAEMDRIGRVLKLNLAPAALATFPTGVFTATLEDYHDDAYPAPPATTQPSRPSAPSQAQIEKHLWDKFRNWADNRVAATEQHLRELQEQVDEQEITAPAQQNTTARTDKIGAIEKTLKAQEMKNVQFDGKIRALTDHVHSNNAKLQDQLDKLQELIEGQTHELSAQKAHWRVQMAKKDREALEQDKRIKVLESRVGNLEEDLALMSGGNNEEEATATRHVRFEAGAPVAPVATRDTGPFNNGGDHHDSARLEGLITAMKAAQSSQYKKHDARIYRLETGLGSLRHMTAPPNVKDEGEETP